MRTKQKQKHKTWFFIKLFFLLGILTLINLNSSYHLVDLTRKRDATNGEGIAQYDTPKKIIQTDTEEDSLLRSEENEKGTSIKMIQNETKTKPVLYLHIGPHKTGTTTLQNQLSFYRKQLADDSIMFYGRNGNQKFSKPLNCRVNGYNHSGGKKCFESLMKALQEELNNGNHFMFSDEYFSQDLAISNTSWNYFQMNQEYLQDLEDLRNDWEVRIFMGYRPWFELVISRHNQIFKPNPKKKKMKLWPKHSGIVPLPLVDILDDTGNYLHWKASVGGHKRWVNPAQVKEVYIKHFKNFQVFDIHEGDLIEHVLCRLL